MDAGAISTFISTVGFPIAACCVMFYYMNKADEKHEEEVKTLSETINNNTIVLTELSTLIKDLVRQKEGE